MPVGQPPLRQPAWRMWSTIGRCSAPFFGAAVPAHRARRAKAAADDDATAAGCRASGDPAAMERSGVALARRNSRCAGRHSTYTLPRRVPGEWNGQSRQRRPRAIIVRDLKAI
eukprot:scaffold8867_cov118-Isochrysis_galbana.AAC.17